MEPLESDSRRILIAEPDASFLEVLKLMLSDYDCICAMDGETAVRLYSKFRPTLVITEIMLPKINGIEATRRILEINPEAKIIGLTAFKRRWGEDLIEAGAAEVIEKPCKKDELLEIVEKHLRE